MKSLKKAVTRFDPAPVINIEANVEDNDDISVATGSVAGDQDAVYFGNDARNLFNERYQMLSRQRKIVVKSAKETVISTYFSGAERDKDSMTVRSAGSTFRLRNRPLRPLSSSISSTTSTLTEATSATAVNAVSSMTANFTGNSATISAEPYGLMKQKKPVMKSESFGPIRTKTSSNDDYDQPKSPKSPLNKLLKAASSDSHLCLLTGDKEVDQKIKKNVNNVKNEVSLSTDLDSSQGGQSGLRVSIDLTSSGGLGSFGSPGGPGSLWCLGGAGSLGGAGFLGATGEGTGEISGLGGLGCMSAMGGSAEGDEGEGGAGGLDLDDDDDVSSTDSFMSELADNDYNASSIAQPLSPRSRFISSCIREGLNPRASLVLRKRMSSHLKLSHLSIGDKVAIILAESLVDLPDVESIDISDNVLTDLSLVPFLEAISTITSLKELNLSSNIIGPKAAKAISTYLSCLSCPLKRLVLKNADVDDYECERFITSIKDNDTLIEIDLSGNKIGSAEALNTVKPDLVTGGEAIAALLRSPKTKLEILKLGWNMIRLSSAVDLGSSLSINATLLYLDLSCNSLGRDGGEAIGEAVLNNRTLETLILSSNGIESKACFTICMGIIENFSLKKVCLDGNPIGVQGAKALMTISMEAGDRVEVTSQGCNIDVKDPHCWFDFSSPYGAYNLNMGNSYDRAVAFALMRLTASHQRIIFSESLYEGAEIRLVQVMSPVEPLVTDHNPEGLSHLEILQSIKQMLARKGYAKELFHDVDKRGQGQIDVQEIKAAMQAIGFDFNGRVCQGLMNKFDINKSGLIDFEEFEVMLDDRAAEVNTRIKNLSGQLIMTLKPPDSDPKDIVVLKGPRSRLSSTVSDNSSLRDESGRRLSCGILDLFIPRYVPPSTGLLYLKVVDAQTIKPMYKVLTDRDQQHLLKAAKESGHAASMMSHAVENTKVHLAGAISLYETMHKETGKMAPILLKVLPLLQNPEDARELLLYVTGGDRMSLLHIKQAIGYALKPLCGQYDGYYCLNLGLEASQLCIRRLLEVSETLRLKQMTQSIVGGYGRTGDTSQKGNWSCFRNETYNHKIPLPITIKTEIPKRGILEFDFMSSSRPPVGGKKIHAVTSKKLFGLLERCKLMTHNDTSEALRYLNKCRDDCNRVVKGTGATISENTEKRAKAIGMHMNEFVANLDKRKHLNEQALLNEVVKIDYEKTKPSPKPVRKDSVKLNASKTDLSSLISEESTSDLGPGSTNTSTEIGRKKSISINKNRKRRLPRESFCSSSDLSEYVQSVLNGTALSVEDLPASSPKKAFSMFFNSEQLCDIIQFHPFSTGSDGIIYAINAAGGEAVKGLKALKGGGYQSSCPPVQDQTAATEEDKATEAEPQRMSHLSIAALSQIQESASNDSGDTTPGVSVSASAALSRTPSISHSSHPSPSRPHTSDTSDNSSGEYTPPRSEKNSPSPDKLYVSGGRRKTVVTNDLKVSQGVLNKKAERSRLLSLPRTTGAENGTEKEMWEEAVNLDLQNFLRSEAVAQVSKAARILSYLEEKLSLVWLKARQLSLILKMFEETGGTNKTEFFGSYRVDLTVSMFSRVLDLHNFELVMHCLTPFEAGCLYMKIGWLKIYNPMKPEGAYVLDIGRTWEERQVVKTLCGLEVHEPGENWMSYTFRWDLESDPIPGWTLTQPWLSNEGMSTRGILAIRYYCGDGKGYYGCKAHTVYRRALCSMVLIDEMECIEDDDDESDRSGTSTPMVYPRTRRVSKAISSKSPLRIDPEGFGTPDNEMNKKSTNTISLPTTPNGTSHGVDESLFKVSAVLSRINDSFDENNEGPQKSTYRSGSKYIADNPGQWLDYFYPKNA